MASANWYTNGVLGQWSGTAARRVDWVNDTIKITLHTSTYTPQQTTHTYYSDLTAELASGSGYTAGGYTMVNKTLTYDGTSKEVRLDADDPQWTAATFTFRYYVIRKDTGTPTTSPLLGFGNMVTDQSIASGTYTLVGDATGWLKDVVS